MFLLLKGDLEGRFDPNFYKVEFRILTKKIKNNTFKHLGKITKFSSESWNQIDFFGNDFPYIEISEIDIVSGEIKNVSKIPKSKAPSRAKMIVRENDIIISTTRPNRGAIAKIDKLIDFSIASTGFSVIRGLKTDEIKKDFLFYILRQKLCLTQMEQRSSGGNYPAISQEELSNVLIPIPPLETQQKIIEIFEQAYATKKANEAQAKALLASIDAYLLEQLGIVLPNKIEEKNVFYVPFSKMQGNRFDPFYHKDEFEINNDAVLKGKFKVETIKEICKNLIKGRLPKDSEKDGNCKVVQINSVKIDGSIDLEDLLTAKPIFTQNQLLQENDVLSNDVLINSPILLSLH